MASDDYVVRPSGPVTHRPIGGPGALKAGTLVDASEVVDQVVTLAGVTDRARIYFKSAVAGAITTAFLRPRGKASDVYAAVPVVSTPVVANTELVIDIPASKYSGESQMLLTFTGDAGIGSPGAILYADICGV